MAWQRLTLGALKKSCAILVLTLATLTMVCSAAAHAASYTPVSGMNGLDVSQLPSSQWGLHLAAMRADGVQLVRSDADWGTIEPDPPGPNGHTWQFASTDQWVSALAAKHLTWQPILDYDNSWAQAVKNNAAFAEFGQAVAGRYGDNGTFWAEHPELPYLPVKIFEVWNEENGQPWYINQRDYGPLYAATRSDIHQVDPQASVDVGGLSDDSGDYDPNQDYPSWYVLRMMYTYPSLQGNVDGFALHPYATTAKDALEFIADFRHTINLFHESSAPIDITEFGWVTGDAGQEAWRATQMQQLGSALAHSSYGIREVAPYDWINPTVLNEPGDFGFVDRSGTSTALRPAAAAWFDAFNPPVQATAAAAPKKQPHPHPRPQRKHPIRLL